VNRFKPGQVVETPGALAALEASGESLLDYLRRHLSGDWGDLKPEDQRENEFSLKVGLRIMSVYKLKTGVTIWAITEADRSSTCVLLPEEY
jgi:hypothetical protein